MICLGTKVDEAEELLTSRVKTRLGHITRPQLKTKI